MNNFSVDGPGPKTTRFLENIHNMDGGMILIQEHGLHERVLHEEATFKGQMAPGFRQGEAKIVTAYNRHFHKQDKRCYGGTAAIATFNLAAYTCGAGIDESGLGRWVWSRIQGRNGVRATFYSVYRPCPNKTGEQSVLNQHKTNFNSQNDDRDPRIAILEDLKKDVKKRIDDGDHIIIGADMNDNIEGPLIRNFFRDLGMRNLVLSTHGSQGAPPTHARNSNYSVDGIWATGGVHVTQCGYMSAGEMGGTEDHRPIWFDAAFSSLLGHPLPPLAPPQARRLKLDDPRCLKRYDAKMTELSRQHRLAERTFALEKSLVGTTYTPEQEKEANAIDNIRTQCMLRANKLCRTPKYGAVPFSKETQESRKKIEFWSMVLKKRNGYNINGRTYLRAKKQAKVKGPTKHLLLEEIKARYKEAWGGYWKDKKNAQSTRSKFIDGFKEPHRSRIKRNEEARRKGRLAKKASGKAHNGAVSMVMIPDPSNPTGDRLTLRTKSQLEGAIIPECKAKHRKTENAAFMQSPLLDVLGYKGNTAAAQEILQGTFEPPTNTSEVAQQLIKSMVLPPSFQPNHKQSTFITTEEHILADGFLVRGQW